MAATLVIAKRIVSGRAALLALLLLLIEACGLANADLRQIYPNDAHLTPGTFLPLIAELSINDLDAADVAEIFDTCNVDFARKLLEGAKWKVDYEDSYSSAFNETDTAGGWDKAISAHYLHLMSRAEDRQLSATGRILQYVLFDLLQTFANRSEEFKSACIDFVTRSLNRTQLASTCNVKIICNASDPYRTADGSCNNLEHPNYGKSFTRLQRFAGNAYDDDVGAPRTRASDGSVLPSARQITNWLVSRQPNLDSQISHMHMQWGQFLTHDFSVTPMITSLTGTPVLCCAEDLRDKLGLDDNGIRNLQAELNVRPECFNIPIPADEQRFKNRTCINFVRSTAALPDNCAPRHREQPNSLTSFIDASMIYGSTQQQQNGLRSFSRGLLKVQKMIDVGDLLPKAGNQTCRNSVETNLCFVAGDSRSNEQPGLASVHTLFVREHNRIATNLATINGGWDDEKLFQETRKIMSAVIQHISYSEFLPPSVGEALYTAHGLKPLASGYFKGYNALVDAGVRTEFSTVAFRYGHAQIRGCFSLANEKLKTNGCYLLRDNFFKPDACYNGTIQGPDSVVRGLMADRAQLFGRRITTEVVDHLFTAGNPSPLDLPAFNIQRGRDHGIPSYTILRKILGMSVPKNFDELADTHDNYEIYLFKRVYADVSDNDAFIGGITERPIVGAILGPSFAKITALQMELFKTGDRFFYEGDAYPAPFTLNQLSELRKSSFNSVICNNIKISRLQQNPFYVPSRTNPWITCANVPTIDLRHWKA